LFGVIVPSLEDPGTAYRFPCYRLSDDELRSFRESFPNHDPTNPPWHLIEQRLRCVTFGQLELISVPEILGHLRDWNPSTRDNHRWGVVAMPATPCGQFAEFVLELFDAAWNAHELDQLRPKIESHVERILNAWPTKESTLGLLRNAVSEVSGHAREEKIIDLLSQFRGEIDRLEESVREYSQWHKGGFGQCSIASPETALFARFAELIPFAVPETQAATEQSTHGDSTDPSSQNPTPPPDSDEWPPNKGWHFRPGEAAFRGIAFKLTDTQWEILKLLSVSRRPVEKNRLLGIRDSGIEESTLRSHISKIRKAIRGAFRLNGDPIPQRGSGKNLSYFLNEEVFLETA